MLGNSTIRSIAHEDNSSALSLATDQRITSRTRHYAVKWHFFWEHVRNGTIEVVKVPTTDQCADYLTKGLVREVFERCRRYEINRYFAQGKGQIIPFQEAA